MSRKTLFLLTAIFFLSGGVLHSQEMEVKSFQRKDRDLLARTQERLDLNEEPCAIVRVSVPKAKDFSFEGNIVGNVIYKPGEAIVYMASRSRNITIRNEQYGTLRFDFPERLEKQIVYSLDLKLILSEDQKVRTLVMPVVGVGKTFSYGIMIGVVRKTGGYLKIKYNFKNINSDYTCNADGIIEGNDTPSWFTGHKESSRLAITGGLLQRIASPLYLYAGAGYGSRIMGWEMPDDQMAECKDYSYEGVEAEVGCILRIKNIALSAGVQTNSFKYWEATAGIGIMF